MGFALLLLMIAIPVILPAAAKWEGRLLPVVKDVRLSNVQRQENGIRFDIAFNKVRDCVYEGLIWYTVNGDTLEGRPIHFPSDQSSSDQSDNSRALGRQLSRGWMVEMTPEEFENSFVVVRHSCHPLWDTRTQMIP